ncbi:MAG: hypothetical protein R3330_19015, partial [Saprospiraceae bacterium]|nr:hypothetical protein [Saprospiraceae bacterium]
MDRTRDHIVREVFRHRRSGWAVGVLVVFCFLALFGDFIANDKPLYCKIEGKSYFPVFRAIPVNLGLASWPEALRDGDWHNKPYERVVYPPIPYRASNLDLSNAGFRSPFGKQQVRNLWFRHWLGTDDLGRDTLAGLIRGCRVSLLVGLASMLLAALIGVPLGAIGGYFGDRRFRAPVRSVILVTVAIILAALYL